eukprot:21057-Heterococcus_DN1.PRE.4
MNIAARITLLVGSSTSDHVASFWCCEIVLHIVRRLQFVVAIKHRKQHMHSKHRSCRSMAVQLPVSLLSTSRAEQTLCAGQSDSMLSTEEALQHGSV